MTTPAPESAAQASTTPPPASPAHAAPASEPSGGWFTHELGKLIPHAKHAETEVADIVADSRNFVTGHAGIVLDFTGDAMALLDLVDPADAALFAAVKALVPKAIAAGQSALTLASAALKAA
jgi:hypothetical protein